MRIIRSHPVLVAAIVGAVVGTGNTLWIEIGGSAPRVSGGVLPLLWASSAHQGQLNPVQAATLLLIEFVGNLLAFAFLFVVPVALFLGVRRIFTARTAAPDHPDPASANRQDHP